MKKAKVLFEYEPQEDDELALKVGDIITDIKDADVGWCEGSLNGKRGMFPDNFVEMLKEEEEKKAPPPPAANKKPSKKKPLRRMKINFAYTAENDDELSLEIGDIIEILKDVEEGWAEGMKKGKRGVFPTNFGDIIESSSDSAEEPTEPVEDEMEVKQTEELASSSQKKVKGIGFGNIFGDGPIKLRQRSIGEGDKRKNLSTPPAKTTTPVKDKEPAKDTTPAKPKKTLNYCRVMFDYAKDNDDELELKKGEVIVILNKNPGDDGWWEGEKEENGKRIKGVFPDNFVAELTPDEAREYERQTQAKSEPEQVKETKPMKPQNKESRKSTPMMPAPPSQMTKPVVTNDSSVTESTDAHFTEPKTTEHTLSHVKRPAGPKNRRKPAASERREKAAASSGAQEPVDGIAEESEEEETRPEKSPEPAPKKESVKRGVAVLPGLGGPAAEGGSGETPSWLQNLKNRQSVKKPPPPTQPKDSGSSEPPPWLANLKKRQSSEFPDKTPAPAPAKEKVPLQPKIPAEKPKPPQEKAKPPPEKAANGPAALVPPTKPAGPKPAQKPSAQSPTEKPLAAWQIERQQKQRKTKTSETQDEKAPEPPSEITAPTSDIPPQPAWKNSLNRKTAPVTAAKSPTEAHPPPTASVKKPDRPPVGAPITTPAGPPRAKPPPPKGKPAPAAKPASSTAVEELKNEMKNMKDEMAKMREEMKKEIVRLNSELENERNHRKSLEDEVRRLRQQVSS